MSNILISPIIGLILVGTLTGVVGVLAVLGGQVFFAEAVTHVAFSGAIVDVVITAALGLNRSQISMFLFTGAFLMCIPIGTLFGLSKVETTSLTTRIVLTFGFALGYFLSKWFAPLPVKVESFLVGSILNMNEIDVALSDGLSLLVAVVLAARWRQLIYSTFNPESFGATHSRRKAWLVINGLIVLTLVTLIPAVDTILSIALLATSVAALIGIVNDTCLLFVLAPLMGIAISLVGLSITVAANPSVGGCTSVCAGCFYVPLEITATHNNAKVQRMHVGDLPVKTQDYLKVIWDLYKCIGEKVALGDVAERMGEKKSTASRTVKKLAARDLVNHEPCRGISLSDRGRNTALIIVRRHRLIESFLVSTLGYTWGEVHEEARKPEHTVSGEFVNHIDAMLGFPERDPHSNPIPSASGTIASAIRTDLTDIEAGAMVVVDCINDSDPESLHYLVTLGVGPRTVLRAETTPYAGIHVFAILDKVGNAEPEEIHVADSALWAIKATPAAS